MIEWLRIKINFMWIFLFNKLRSIFCSSLKPVLQSTCLLCLCLTFSFHFHCVSHSNFFFVCFDLCIQNLFIHYYVRNVHRLYKSLKNIGIHRKTKRMNHKKEWTASYVMRFRATFVRNFKRNFLIKKNNFCEIFKSLKKV